MDTRPHRLWVRSEAFTLGNGVRLSVGLPRGGVTGTHRAHNPDDAGSNPVLATKAGSVPGPARRQNAAHLIPCSSRAERPAVNRLILVRLQVGERRSWWRSSAGQSVRLSAGGPSVRIRSSPQTLRSHPEKGDWPRGSQLARTRAGPVRPDRGQSPPCPRSSVAEHLDDNQEAAGSAPAAGTRPLWRNG